MTVSLGLAPCLSALLLRPSLVLHAQQAPGSRTPSNAIMESADSSLVSPAAVASALKAEEAQRTRWEAETELPRAERRKRTSATRDLSQSFITVGVEPRQARTRLTLQGRLRCDTPPHASAQAVKYAERLVDRGVRSLEGLDADMMAACGTPSSSSNRARNLRHNFRHNLRKHDLHPRSPIWFLVPLSQGCALLRAGVLAVHREQIKAASLGVSARTARVAAPELVTALGGQVGGEVEEALDAGEEAELGELGEEEEGQEEEEEGQERTLTISADLDGKRLDAALAALLPPLQPWP